MLKMDFEDNWIRQRMSNVDLVLCLIFEFMYGSFDDLPILVYFKSSAI